MEGRRPAQDRTLRFPGKGANLPTDSGSLFSSFQMPQHLIQISSVCMRRSRQVRGDLRTETFERLAVRELQSPYIPEFFWTVEPSGRPT